MSRAIEAQVGVVFPQTEIGTDPGLVRAYAQTAEEVGYDHLLAYEHVVGANPPPGSSDWPYQLESPFFEPLALFAHLSAVTSRISFATAVLILPQRQAALVAKQAATVDVLSGGRLRLGVGIGWNPVEYEALGVPFGNRAARLEEHVDVLRRLWTQPEVSFDGRWQSLDGVGIRPRPDRVIPIWYGGKADAVLRRVAADGAGWLAPGFPHPDAASGRLARLRVLIEERGRPFGDIGLEFRIGYGNGDPQRWLELARGWVDAGATHVSLNTMDLGWEPGRHLDAMVRFAETLGLSQ